MIDISIAIVAYRNYEDVIEAVSSIEKIYIEDDYKSRSIS